MVATEDQRSLWTLALQDVAWVVGELLTENKYVFFFFSFGNLMTDGYKTTPSQQEATIADRA